MATYNVPITIPDGSASEILLNIEKKAGRARDPDTGVPIQSHLEYIGDLCRWYLLSLARSGRKTEHRENYNATYTPISDTDITN